MSSLPRVARIHRDRLVPFAVAAIAALAGIALVSVLESPVKVAVVVVAAAGAVLIALDNELGLFALVFLSYTHLSQVLISHHGAPSTATPLTLLLLGLVAFGITMRKVPLRPVALASVPLIAYGVACSATLLVATYPEATLEGLRGYANDAVTAIVVVALLRTRRSLSGTVWTLMAAGAFLGAMSVHQEMTESYDDAYWGFGLSAVQDIVGSAQDYRVAGPVGDPNFYALFLVPIIPLALNRLDAERSKLLRALALFTFVVVALTIVFTYSRGGFLAMSSAIALTLIRKPPRARVIFFTLLVAIPVLSLVPAQYTARLTTLNEVLPFGRHEIGTTRDSGFKGRVSEMRVGVLMFLEEPLLGVGLDNYPYLYQEYARRVGLDSRLAEREPHSRYLEIASEMGVVGIAAYGLVIACLFWSMRVGEKRLRAGGCEDAAGMVRSLSVGVVGFLVGSVFLHEAFARFFWLLAGIALATSNVACDGVEGNGASGSEEQGT